MKDYVTLISWIYLVTNTVRVFVGNFLCTGVVTLIASIKRLNCKLNVEAHG